LHSSLFAITPAVVAPPATIQPVAVRIDSLDLSQALSFAPIRAAGAEAGTDHAPAGHEGAGIGPGRGTTKVAELLAKAGDACPVLRRPRHLEDTERGLEVAVLFVVDTLGAVDPTTVRVVQAPGVAPKPTGFVPHIYAVSATVRVDRSMPETVPAYGAKVAGDVVQHVSTLRFRPGTRNGRPARSSVLVACQEALDW
jgi:hypothetical protein